MFYVFGEDLVSGLVGPFQTRESALEHIEFQRARGDAAVCCHDNARVVTTQEIQSDRKLLWAFNNNLATPERDREFA